MDQRDKENEIILKLDECEKKIDHYFSRSMASTKRPVTNLPLSPAINPTRRA